MAETNSVSFLGLGTMGTPMANHLLEKGFNVVLWNRTPEKAKDLLETNKNAKLASSASEAMRKTDVSILMLWDAKSVQQVLDDLPQEDYKTKGGKPRTFVGMVTISPEQSKEIGKKVHEKGGKYIEAPVIGNIYAAKAAQLKVFVGSDDKEVDPQVIKIFSAFGYPAHVGAIGNAATTKLAINYFLASTFASFSTAYAWIERTGDVRPFMSFIEDGKFSLTPYFKSWSEKFSKRQYDPFTFAAAGIDKDVSLAFGEMKKSGINTSAIEGTHKLIHEAISNLDIGEKDWSTIYEHVNPKQ